MFHMLVSAAQFQRDLDSERMTAIMARTFEEGATGATTRSVTRRSK